MDKKRLLCTGSCGFIFGNFLRKAVYEKQPYQLISIDRVNNNSLNSMYWNKNHTFHIADITDEHIIDKIFDLEKPEIVVHGAAETEAFIDPSLKNTNSLVKSNVLGTQSIINACIKHKVKKLVYISADEVYGYSTLENQSSWKEDDNLNPSNSYLATKAAGELLVKAANQSFGLNYNITRCSNNYGPRETLNKLIPKTIKCILNKEPIFVYDEDLQMKDWIHVYDNCSAIFTILNNGNENETYNISSNQEFKNIDIINQVCNIMGKGHDLITFLNDSKNDDYFKCVIDSSKIRNLNVSNISK